MTRKDLIQLLQIGEKFTTAEIADRYSLTRRKAQNMISNLILDGDVKRVGARTYNKALQGIFVRIANQQAEGLMPPFSLTQNYSVPVVHGRLGL